MSFAEGDLIDARYRVVAPLGEGGMGAVYVVEHVHMKKRLALKVLRADVQGAEILARFEREAMAAAHIDHPNVVAATDFGHTADGSVYMVMELVQGASLRDALEAGAMPEPRALAIARQIASALAKAHELGIIHRDLKPENVMLVPRDDGEQVKVLDFGIAKVELGHLTGAPGQALTQIGAVFGTPEYMAPEQAQGQPVDARADLYALGVILFEMLAGARPFEADDHVALLLKHVTEAPPSVRTRTPVTSLPAEQLVARLLAKSPDARPSTAREVIAAIDAVSGETPAPVSVVVAPPSTRAAPASSIAKTQQALTIPTPLRQAARKLPEAVQRIPKPALIAFGALVLLVPMVVVLAFARRPAGQAVPSASTTRAAPEERAEASEAELAAAHAKGVSALAALWEKYPRDGRLGRMVVSLYAQEQRWTEACRALAKLANVDPSAAKEPEMQRAATSALQQGDAKDQDAALDALIVLGETGVDLLLDLQSQSKLAAPLKQKIGDVLARPEARARASPAALVLMDLKAAKRCDDKHELLARAKESGDARTLALIKPMKSTRGCGFLGMQDCWSCMRQDGALEEAIAALEARR